MQGARIILLAQIDSEKNTEQIEVTGSKVKFSNCSDCLENCHGCTLGHPKDQILRVISGSNLLYKI